jgi:hypothetical protein
MAGEIDRGREAFRRQAWADAFSRLSSADRKAADVFLDLNMPVWRFQLQGAAALAEQRMIRP